MKKIFLLCCLGLTACGAQLRKPFCTSYLPTFPPEFDGVYEVVMPSQSAEWSGNQILKTLQVRFGDKFVSASQPVPGMPDWGAFCKVNGRYFVEQRNSNGTYSITEISQFSQGLIMSIIAFDLDAARVKNFKLHYFPDLSRAVKDIDMQWDLLGSRAFTLDNSHLTADQVLSVSKPLSLQMVLRSVPPATARKFSPRVKAELTPTGLRRRGA